MSNTEELPMTKASAEAQALFESSDIMKMCHQLAGVIAHQATNIRRQRLGRTDVPPVLSMKEVGQELYLSGLPFIKTNVDMISYKSSSHKPTIACLAAELTVKPPEDV